MLTQHAVLLQTYGWRRRGNPFVITDYFLSSSVGFISGRLYFYDVDSRPRLQHFDDDVDDRLIIKNAVTLVRYMQYRNMSGCVVTTFRIAVRFKVSRGR